MKYWRGYLTAAILGFFTWALMEFAKTHTALIDMVYPYVTRMIQGFLAEWSAGVSFCLWQVIAVALIMGIMASIVLMIVFRWNFIQWLGWVVAGASILLFCHTAVYGLNGYAGSISEDLRLEMSEYTQDELEQATIYFRDQANALASQIHRDANGDPEYPSFQEMAQQAGEGFQNLVYQDAQPIFAGSTLPVKELGWADMYTSMGITGFTMSLTGEAAVNPQIPAVSIPFTMCHEMAHRMSIATESDANMAAFLACRANSGIEFQYSAFFMAYRYCYNALYSHDAEAARAIKEGINDALYQDLSYYNRFFTEHRDETAEQVADTVNDTYIKLGGDERGTASYGAVCDLLVCWHIQEIILPLEMEEETEFDPFDESQVDLTGIANAKVSDE